MVYQVWVFLHLVGVVLFFSGFTASLFLKQRADRTRDPEILAFTFSLLNFNDRWFTPPSILLIVAGGIGAAAVAGLPIVGTGWVFWSLVLFGISGVIFLGRALPIQHRLEQLTVAAVASGVLDWTSYRVLATRWSRWATLAFVCVVGAFVLMVFKPLLPAP